MNMKKILLLSIMMLFLLTPAGETDAKTIKKYPRQSVRWDDVTGEEGMRAYLRLPQGQQKVKALLYCHQNMTEEVLFRSTLFTHKMDSLGVAMAFIQQGSQNWDVTKGCQERFEQIIRHFEIGRAHV